MTPVPSLVSLWLFIFDCGRQQFQKIYHYQHIEAEFVFEPLKLRLRKHMHLFLFGRSLHVRRNDNRPEIINLNLIVNRSFLSSNSFLTLHFDFQMSDCVKWGSVGMNAGLIMVMNRQKSHSMSAAH